MGGAAILTTAAAFYFSLGRLLMQFGLRRLAGNLKHGGKVAE
jgi:hypothetical protein